MSRWSRCCVPFLTSCNTHTTPLPLGLSLSHPPPTHTHTSTSASTPTRAAQLALRLPDDENVQNLMTYVLEMARYDTDTDLRDRSRFVTALMGLAPSTETEAEGGGAAPAAVDEQALELLAEHAMGIMLAPKVGVMGDGWAETTATNFPFSHAALCPSPFALFPLPRLTLTRHGNPPTPTPRQLPPVTLLGTVDVEGLPNFTLGSLSSLMGHYIAGYQVRPPPGRHTYARVQSDQWCPFPFPAAAWLARSAAGPQCPRRDPPHER